MMFVNLVTFVKYVKYVKHVTFVKYVVFMSYKYDKVSLIRYSWDKLG